jgi:phosphatidylinositol-3-phosphatase
MKCAGKFNRDFSFGSRFKPLSGRVTGSQPARHIRRRIITIVTFTFRTGVWLSQVERGKPENPRGTATTKTKENRMFMETKSHINPLNGTNNKLESSSRQRGKFRCTAALAGAAVAGVLLAAQTTKADDGYGRSRVGDVFVIALENHNFTQPNPTASPQQILGNPAAPYINRLITPGNPNAAQVSYALNYYNAGHGEHPSEPNYVWAEAGSDFGAHTDADPRSANGNTFYYNSPGLVSQLTANGNTVVFWHHNDTPHLARQLDDAGIPWKDYQEDIELSASPTNSAFGTNGPVNPYNGTTQYNYAVKHNPMGLFSDTALENVYPLAQLFDDLSHNTVGRYNWITPDQYNEAHSSLINGFTYQGVHYTGDQSSVAAADNFLSTVIPEIMASKAYQDNGVIILWWDETEGGDTAGQTIPEIVLSPLAKGNAYASTVPMNHSSDLKTMDELFGLPFVNNPIPASETNVDGGYNNVATVNDLSDLFVPGAIPSAPVFSVTSGNFEVNKHTGRVMQQVHINNNSNTSAPAPLWLVLDDLSANATLLNADGATAVLAPLGSPCVRVHLGADQVLRPHEYVTATLEFLDPSAAPITYNTRVLDVTPAP